MVDDGLLVAAIARLPPRLVDEELSAVLLELPRESLLGFVTELERVARTTDLSEQDRAGSVRVLGLNPDLAERVASLLRRAAGWDH